MPHSEMKNAPPLYGWTIAVAAGAVATAVSFLMIGIEGNGSVAIGAVITLAVGVIFTIAETPPSRKPVEPTQQVTAKTAATPAAATPAAATETSAPASAAPAPAAPTPAPAATMPETAPAAAAAPAAASESGTHEEGVQPQALEAPVGAADDLKQITGVGPVLEGKLNDLGIYHFWQIAGWSVAEVTWVDGFLNSKGRIVRDEWIDQASKLAASNPAKPAV